MDPQRGLEEVLKTHHRKTDFVTKWILLARAWTDPIVRPKQWKRETRFGTWNVTHPYMSVSLTAAARELARYKLDLVGVQEVKWDKGGQGKSSRLYFFFGKQTKIINWERVCLYTTDYYLLLTE